MARHLVALAAVETATALVWVEAETEQDAVDRVAEAYLLGRLESMVSRDGDYEPMLGIVGPDGRIPDRWELGADGRDGDVWDASEAADGLPKDVPLEEKEVER